MFQTKKLPARSVAAIRAGLRDVLKAKNIPAQLKMRAAELLLEIESGLSAPEQAAVKPKANRLFDLLERQKRKGLPKAQAAQSGEQKEPENNPAQLQ